MITTKLKYDWKLLNCSCFNVIFNVNEIAGFGHFLLRNNGVCRVETEQIM